MTKVEAALVSMLAAVLMFAVLALVEALFHFMPSPVSAISAAPARAVSAAQVSALRPPPSISEIVVARTLYDECRGEPPEGRRLVASTLWRDAGGDPARLQAAALKLYRYSCWDRKPRDLVTLSTAPVPLNTLDARAWDDCVVLAEMMHNGQFRPVGLSDDDMLALLPTNYHRNDGHRRPWPGVQKVVGNHRFYFNVTGRI